MRTKQFAVYIMASATGGTLYVGVTSDLIARTHQHREGLLPGFTSRHGVKTLVWFELHDTAEAAITREKRLKQWRRDWKIRLIEQFNPDWRDLYPALTQPT